MITLLPALFSLCIFIIYNVACVRIFHNILPTAEPIRFKSQVISKTCLLKPEQGPCRSGIKMFYFDPATARCSTFDWGGCQGNGNRFRTEEECANTCLSKPGDARRRPTWCSLTFEYGYCFGAIEKWYFDKLWQVCKKTIYSGCGGNRNNFASQEMCESVCIYAKDKNMRKFKRMKNDDSNKYLIIDNKKSLRTETRQDAQTSQKEKDGHSDKDSNSGKVDTPLNEGKDNQLKADGKSDPGKLEGHDQKFENVKLELTGLAKQSQKVEEGDTGSGKLEGHSKKGKNELPEYEQQGENGKKVENEARRRWY